jgi:hypothetical protein
LVTICEFRWREDPWLLDELKAKIQGTTTWLPDTSEPQEKSADLPTSSRDDLGELICVMYVAGSLGKEIANAINADGRWKAGWNKDRVNKELRRYLDRHPEIHMQRHKHAAE